jgi:hypothetical protein
MSRFFLLFCSIFLCFVSFSFAAETNIYSVENVAVSVVGKSPNDARNLAVATARRDAFLILLTRLDLNINIADNVTNDEISDMVRSEQTDGEKVAGSNYSATFNILFAKDFVDHILAQKKPSLSPDNKDRVAESYLLIPVKIVKKQPIFWEENNDWKKAIAKTLTKKNLSKKFILPEADLNNLSLLGRDNVALASYSELEPMMLRYNSAAAYSLFFNFDEIENKVNISVSYVRKMQKKQFKLTFINVDRLGGQALVEKVADKVIDYLNSPKVFENKALKANIVRLQIPVTSLNNWLAMKNKIENSGLVNQISIESLASDRAIISANYTNSEIDIAESFLSIGISLVKKSENFYIIF